MESLLNTLPYTGENENSLLSAEFTLLSGLLLLLNEEKKDKINKIRLNSETLQKL